MIFDRVCIELEAIWITVDDGDFNYQQHVGHRWSVKAVSEDQLEELTKRLSQIGKVKVDEDAHPASIKIAPTVYHDRNVARIVSVLDDMFGDDFDTAS